MSRQQNNAKRGFSIIETMIALTILIIAVLGTIGFRYNATLDGRKAARQANASRLALMLAQDWAGRKGDLAYDIYKDKEKYKDYLDISYASGPDEDLTHKLNSWEFKQNDQNIYATLSHNDLISGLRALNVIVAWDPQNELTSYDSTMKTYSLTLYVEP